MYYHAPPDYVCPLCRFIAGENNESPWSQQTDIVRKNELVTAFICAKQWPCTPGHVLVVPNTHYENLYELPEDIGSEIFQMSRSIALAFKEVYHCHGVSVRQHNKPAGNQDVWHYHMHVFPRYERNDLYPYQGTIMSPEERALYAVRLRTYFESNPLR